MWTRSSGHAPRPAPPCSRVLSAQVYWPQAKEINTKYKPDLMWSDGDNGNESWWRSTEFLAWLYNEAPNRESVVVNDRWGWGNPPIGSGHHGGYFSGSDRQKADPKMLKHKWESAFTIDMHNWGNARNDPLQEYLNITAILYQVASVVAYGGNVLINVGPTHEGTISPIFQERLLQLGAWLSINGEAIYATQRWRVQNETANTSPGHGIYYTASKGAAGTVFAISLGWPGDQLELRHPVATATTAVRLLGTDASVTFQRAAKGITLAVPRLPPGTLAEGTPWVFELTNVA